MSTHKKVAIALGMITRHFNDPGPILRFLDNASAYGHTVDRIIVAYSHTMDQAAVEKVRKHIPLELVKASNPCTLWDRLREIGLSDQAIHDLLDLPDGGASGEVPYGSYRNAVLFTALLDGVDYLLFFDTDIEPRVLTKLEREHTEWEEIDFVGVHMRSLAQEQVAATTSDYSGYYIIPPMSFPGLGEFLTGLGKGMAVEYMDDCRVHHCLNLGSKAPGQPRPTDKPLGGNLGLDLTMPWRLAPFYSTLYRYAGSTIRSRGEDTLLGQAITASHGQIMDIDLKVFHDTYAFFPEVPDIHRPKIRDRFYWACLGWIGRNPFLSWYLDQIGQLQTDWRSETTLQRIGLEVGGEQAAEYLKDPRFKILPAAFEASILCLPDSIERYQRLMHGWESLLKTVGRERPPSEVEDEDVGELRLAS
jgi:hypothetical protein